jgi:hypothetical protein
MLDRVPEFAEKACPGAYPSWGVSADHLGDPLGEVLSSLPVQSDRDYD